MDGKLKNAVMGLASWSWNVFRSDSVDAKCRWADHGSCGGGLIFRERKLADPVSNIDSGWKATQTGVWDESLRPESETRVWDRSLRPESETGVWYRSLRPESETGVWDQSLRR